MKSIAKGRTDRAYQTIRKQDSIWENHLKALFGNKNIDEVSVAAVNDSEGFLREKRKQKSVNAFTCFLL